MTRDAYMHYECNTYAEQCNSIYICLIHWLVCLTPCNLGRTGIFASILGHEKTKSWVLLCECSLRYPMHMASVFPFMYKQSKIIITKILKKLRRVQYKDAFIQIRSKSIFDFGSGKKSFSSSAWLNINFNNHILIPFTFHLLTTENM